MKRKLLSVVLIFLLCTALSAAAFAAVDISGSYDAVRCEKDGIQYDSDGEYLQLESDGTGTVTFGGMPYGIEWTLTGNRFHFVDDDGYEMDGTYSEGVITGNYASYDFTYKLNASASPSPEPAQTPEPSPTPEPIIEIAPAAQTDLRTAAGTYYAVSCTKDGSSYVCDNDALELREDGTGTVLFDGAPFSIEWSLSGTDFAFADEDGDVMEGTLTGGTITGNYIGYAYVFERGDAAPLPAAVDDGTIPGTYYAESCQSGGSYYDVKSEYLVLNEDGSAMLVSGGCAYPSVWTLDGERFALRATRPNGTDEMNGELSGGVLTCDYANCQYVYRKGAPAPITSLSPSSWGRGLPAFVTDQADIILNDIDEGRLNTKAQELVQYRCGVYIVTLDDMNAFSPSRSIESCAEELRVGYDLGCGDGRDCILLLMSMKDRSYDLCVYGDYASEVFNDYARSTIEDAMLGDFSRNEWYDGFSAYLSQCETLLNAAASGKMITATNNPAAHTRHVIIPIVLAFLVSLVFCLIKKGRMRSVAEQQRAAGYIPEKGVNIAFRYDQFTHATETRVYDPPQSKSSSGGGGSSSSGHSHSSGHF